MEMEMGMDSLSFYQQQQQHLNPPSPSSGGQQAFSSSNDFYPPYAAAAMATNRRDADPTAPSPPPSWQGQRAAAARKDQHSKICTAGGMRDRRMRLSLDVARRFFSLQDTLGFDKASKTVQWLLDMSTAGISDLLAAASTTSVSMSEEDGSGSVLLDSNDHVMAADAISAEINSCKTPTKSRRRAGRRSNNGAPAPLPDKESRARARQRARERTVERNRLGSSSASTVAAAHEAPVPAPSPARQMILPATPSFGSYYEEQEPWELGGVVFAKRRLHY